jgi:hypothetical protein
LKIGVAEDSPTKQETPLTNLESTAKTGFLFKMARRAREKPGFSTPEHLFAVESIFNPHSSIFGGFMSELENRLNAIVERVDAIRGRL